MQQSDQLDVIRIPQFEASNKVPTTLVDKKDAVDLESQLDSMASTTASIERNPLIRESHERVLDVLA